MLFQPWKTNQTISDLPIDSAEQIRLKYQKMQRFWYSAMFYFFVAESVLGVYARNGWHIYAASCEYAPQPALSMLTAGILFVISGIFVVSKESGNISATSFFAPRGDMK